MGKSECTPSLKMVFLARTEAEENMMTGWYSPREGTAIGGEVEVVAISSIPQNDQFKPLLTT